MSTMGVTDTMSKELRETKLKLGKRLSLELPSALAKRFGLSKGGEIFITGTAKAIEIRPAGPPRIILPGLYAVGGLGSSYQWDAATYLLSNAGEACMIDCGTDLGFERIVNNLMSFQIEPSKISQIILTHCHYDHCAGAYLFKEKFGCHVASHKLGKEPIEDGDEYRTASFVFGKQFPRCKVDRTFSDGDEARVGKLSMRVLDLPGHCPDNMGLYVTLSGRKVCFVGDIGGAHSHRWASSIEQSKTTVDKLLEMDIDMLCHGHFVYDQRENVVSALNTWKVMFEDGVFEYFLSRHRGFYGV